MRKKLIVIIGLALTLGFLMSTSVSAQIYDGLWITPLDPSTFTLIVDNGELLIAVPFDLKGTYFVYLGQLTKGAAEIVNIYPSTFKSAGTINFTSRTNGILTINSCTGDCAGLGLPVGFEIPIIRPWPGVE